MDWLCNGHFLRWYQRMNMNKTLPAYVYGVRMGGHAYATDVGGWHGMHGREQWRRGTAIGRVPGVAATRHSL